MAVTTDIARTWRGPRRVVRDLLAQGEREDRAVVYLMAACFLIFVAQWPRLVRVAEGLETQPGLEEIPQMQQLVAYEFLAWLMIWPLAMYGLSALSHIVARLVGGKGSFYTARLALFWALLASVPGAIFYGLVRGLIGPGLEAQIAGGVWVGVFLWFWIAGLMEAERAT